VFAHVYLWRQLILIEEQRKINLASASIENRTCLECKFAQICNKNELEPEERTRNNFRLHAGISFQLLRGLKSLKGHLGWRIRIKSCRRLCRNRAYSCPSTDKRFRNEYLAPSRSNNSSTRLQVVSKLHYECGKNGMQISQTLALSPDWRHGQQKKEGQRAGKQAGKQSTPVKPLFLLLHLLTDESAICAQEIECATSWGQ